MRSFLLLSSRRLAPFTLKPLPYPVENGVPPTISKHQLDLHYNKHHQEHVDKLNAATMGNKDNRSLTDIVRTSKPGMEDFDHAGQVINHTIYWESICPGGSALKGTALADQIEKDFGSFDEFKIKFNTEGALLFGSGWVWLVWCKKSSSLKIQPTKDGRTPLETTTLTPILTCDVWEHAYYVDYENRRPEYLATFWNIVDWQSASRRLEGAQ